MTPRRLTDEELAEFERALQAHRDVIHHEVLPRATFTHRVTFVQMESLLAELRQHRAAALTSEERGIVDWMREVVRQELCDPGLKRDALAVLDRLLAGKGTR